MTLYKYDATDATPVISVNPSARVKQFTVWGAVTSTTCTVQVSESMNTPWDPIIDRKTDAPLELVVGNSTFILHDANFEKIKFATNATGPYYIDVKYWG